MRKYSHQFTDLDPTRLIPRQDPTGFIVPEDFHLKGELDIKKWVDEKQCYLISKSNTLEELHQNLKKVYLNTVGIEFDHVTNSEERLWLYNNFERHMTQELSKSEKANILKLIVQSESLDEHLGVKFSSFKRYSGEGAESSIAGLKTIFAKASELGVEEVVLGMPHRGRLNVLCNLLDYPYGDLVRKIQKKNDMPKEYY